MYDYLIDYSNKNINYSHNESYSHDELNYYHIPY